MVDCSFDALHNASSTHLVLSMCTEDDCFQKEKGILILIQISSLMTAFGCVIDPIKSKSSLNKMQHRNLVHLEGNRKS